MARLSRICMTRSEEPRVVFGSRMKPSIHLAILWREILPIATRSFQTFLIVFFFTEILYFSNFITL